MKIKNILGACLIAGTMIFTPTAGVVPAPVAYAESVADYTEKYPHETNYHTDRGYFGVEF